MNRTFEAVGMVEFSSIARGHEACDAMLKAADVELVLARTICSGKYIALVAGDVAAVESSVDAGVDMGAETVVDSMVIPNVHPAVFPAMSATVRVGVPDALGIVESFSVASLVEAADAAAKASKIDLIEIRLAMALGGKGFVTFTGSVDAVRAAVDAGADPVARKGLLVRKVVIPNPRKELMSGLI
jgi:microcompartment protein CcmL/EutN